MIWCCCWSRSQIGEAQQNARRKKEKKNTKLKQMKTKYNEFVIFKMHKMFSRTHRESNVNVLSIHSVSPVSRYDSPFHSLTLCCTAHACRWLGVLCSIVKFINGFRTLQASPKRNVIYYCRLAFVIISHRCFFSFVRKILFADKIHASSAGATTHRHSRQ